MNQRILITGANRGIGLATAAALLEAGHTVIAGTRRPAESTDLQELATRHPEHLHIVELDVNSDDSVADAYAKSESLVSGLDVLINNAGHFPEKGTEDFADLALSCFGEAFETNVVGVARMIQVFTPLLDRGENPRIVGLSSGAASIAAKTNHNYFAYSTSKAALNMLTRALAAEYRARGICVVALTPGWVSTRMGGPQAPLEPAAAGQDLAVTVTSLTMEQSGHFVDRHGRDTRYGW